MLSTIFKKKVSDEQLANVFVNGILEVIDKGYVEVKSIMEEDPAFVRRPDLSNAADGHFAMIVIVGNVMSLGDSFSSKQQNNLEPLIFNRLAESFQMERHEFKGYFRSEERRVGKECRSWWQRNI